MKIPQTFLIKNKKGIESKIKQLLKEHKEKTARTTIDEKALNLFPKFIDYLKKEAIHNRFISIALEKIPVKKDTWYIYRVYKDEVLDNIGSITSYIKNKDMTSEYGYKADVVIHGLPVRLIYRLGYHCYDTNGKVVSNKDPKRLDSIDMPFP